MRKMRYVDLGNLDLIPQDWQPGRTGMFHVTWSHQGVPIDSAWCFREQLKPLTDYLSKEGYDHVTTYHQRATLDFSKVARIIGD